MQRGAALGKLLPPAIHLGEQLKRAAVLVAAASASTGGGGAALAYERDEAIRGGAPDGGRERGNWPTAILARERQLILRRGAFGPAPKGGTEEES